ncbi:MAG: hypothetical protein JNL79_10355 [Myxococcales bacterium]|nr:hypothetical protein [Myxococcales bacterium]
MFDPHSRARLAPQDAARFSGETLFDRVGRALSELDCLPRQELFEAWEVARRVRRRFRGGRVVDFAAGHGLLAHLLLLLDDRSPRALAVDPSLPASAARVHEGLVAAWPRLAGRVELLARRLEDVALHSGDLVVSAHACGALTDAVIGRAIAASARLAVLPCCHDARTCDDGGLGGWMDAALAIDATRAARLRAAGYRVHTQEIPAAITPKNRLLIAEPAGTVTQSTG